jgi:DNA-binding NtrC family response regulator
MLVVGLRAKLIMDLILKVLIVEDDHAMAQMCAKLIRRRGHTVRIAASGEDALALIREKHDVDVVISDVEMPHMSGIELLTGLRALDATIPVILITGYTHLLSPSQARELGATDFILKPFDPRTLLESLERINQSSHN